MASNSVFESPRVVTDIKECYFYHTMDIPGHGLVEGEWDLRDGVKEYLGKVDLRGKRVLELGTASGFLCFSMEKMGAEVVSYDLSDKHSWDLVPFADFDVKQYQSVWAGHIRRLNNGYWFNHRVLKSNAKVVYGSVYAVPEEIGPVDVSTFGCILLHVRDPFLALASALRLTKETVIITEEGVPKDHSAKGSEACMQFIPDYRKGDPKATWWRLSPQILMEFIGVLGFEKAEVTYHEQKTKNGKAKLHTVVGQRTKGFLKA